MAETLIKNFKQISKSDTEIAGGKGASLGEMTQAGIPVPNGYVILSNSFDRFLEETDLNVEIDAVLDEVDIKEVHTVENASEKIQAMILSKDIPKDIKTEILKIYKKLDCKFVAVRSSATSEDSASAAWAGQLESYLNTTKETLLEKIKKCWASLFTTRAIFYRFENKLNKDKISVAVVIQKMVGSQESGIAFSVHPVTQNENQIIIEAGFGLGEAIVSGSIIPDSYVVDKQGFKILDININEQTKALYKKAKGGNKWKELGEKGKKQVLTKKEIVKLSELIAKIENHYGFPCDIEWAKEKDKLYIVQSRPITTLGEKPISPSKKNNYYFSWGERHSVISTESWLRGYVFLNDIIGNDNRNVFMLVKNGSVQTYNTEEDLPIAHKAGEDILDHKFLKSHLRKTKNIRDKYRTLYHGTKNKKWTKLSNKELLEIFKEYQDLYDKTWAYFKLSQPEYLEPAHEKLHKLLQENFSDIDEKIITLTTPTGIDLIKEEEIASYKLSLKKEISKNDLFKHAQKFPWLFWNTYDIKIILNFLKRKFDDLRIIPQKGRIKHLKQIHEQHLQHKIQFQNIIKSVKKNKIEISYLSSVFGSLAIDRLKLKSWWGGAEYLFLSLFEEIANRANMDVEELFMTYSVIDIESFLKEQKVVTEKVKKSRKKLYAIALIEGELKFYESKEAKTIFENDIKSAKTETLSDNGLRGVSANIGKVTGKAYIVNVEDLKQLIKDMAKFKDGDILVTTMTQPTMVSMARRASAIITNEGGITSHASILAREFKIPCIVGTRTATEKIKTGDTIEVDANKGIVRILNKK
jgi:phosphoenolpyruvate synthase/pyruvate phosphate dikinase